MDQKSEKVKVDPLPDHSNKFWLDADNRTFETKLKSCQNKHTFVMTKKANNVKCDCGIGFILSPGMVLKEGHIYFEEGFVI